MLRSCFTAIVFIAALAHASIAQSREPIPEPINQGLQAYAQSGLNAALEVWLRNALFDRTTLSKSELLALKNADTNHGPFEGGEVLRVARLTTRVSRVYVVLYYNRGPLWAHFDLYQQKSGALVITDLMFSTKVNVILPDELIVP